MWGMSYFACACLTPSSARHSAPDHPPHPTALTQDHIDEVYRDQEAWTEKSIMSTAGSGFFSSDRTILEYAKCVGGGGAGARVCVPNAHFLCFNNTPSVHHPAGTSGTRPRARCRRRIWMTSEGARRAPEKERNCDVGLKQLTPFGMLRNACA